MLYAKVVLGLPVEGPFDYTVPFSLRGKIKIGMRVRVNFRAKDEVAYVVKLAKKTKIKNLKSIQEIIDDSPVIDKNLLSLTRQLSNYYCCSWGEAIKTAIPQGLRGQRRLPKLDYSNAFSETLDKIGTRLSTPALSYARGGYPPSALTSFCFSTTPNVGDGFPLEVTLIHDLDGQGRWDIYLKSIEDTLSNNSSIIVLLPDIISVLKAKDIIKSGLGVLPLVLYRNQTQEISRWLSTKEGKVNIVLGTRSTIFAPVRNLGLVIIDEEQNEAYKQDQVPHYHCREVALMRINIEKAKLILGSANPSLEMFSLARKNKIKYIFIPRKKSFPEIKIIDYQHQYYSQKRKGVLSKYLEDTISLSLNSKDKILLFLNRRGFATSVGCYSCDYVLKCPRCNINLVFHFKDNILSCHYCNFKMSPPRICPQCSSGYIRYSGMGTEKIESELARLFPQARIKKCDTKNRIDIESADIFISTRSIIKETDCIFDLVAVLNIDNVLNRIDFRSSEKTFTLLIGLLRLTQKKLMVQTHLANHHCFQSLVNKDINIFYDEELRERRQLNFPPFRHFGLIKLRGEKEIKVCQLSNALFGRLAAFSKKMRLKVISVNPSHPAKLRDKFYWQILISSVSAERIKTFLKKYLKGFSHSGIIVTVDIDPL